MENEPITSNSIRIQREFDAPVEMVWRAWTEPDLVKLWFGSDPYGTVEKVIMNLIIGGSYQISFSDSDGSKHTCFGEFIIVIKESKLVYTWEWESEPGKISEVDVSFHDNGNKTTLILEHKNLHPESKHNYEIGWNAAINKMAARVIQQKA